ncbi:MAG: ATP-dependent DNA helicase RecG [Armatimonadota bacterium]
MVLAAIPPPAAGGYQSAMMAPTELLAVQHLYRVRETLEALGLRVDLLTGSRPAREREAVRCRVAEGETHVVVGTHALIQEAVSFRRLGLAVIDEQHRFGVAQRAALAAKGGDLAPHVLALTATPIPRTLSLTLYGDLDVSVIDALPLGRKPVRTHWRTGEGREKVYAVVRGLIEQGRQAFVVCPLVDSIEETGAQAATALARDLAGGLLAGISIGVVHGRMPDDERHAVMARFRKGEFGVLVATTVIEVGVDVPNAVVMVIEDADRFGLAQLHQLRGRVGRGEHASFCVLLADPQNDEGRARLETIVSTTDGFVVAEEDLRLRGPGEFLGTRQSGLPPLRTARLSDDRDLVLAAKEDARLLLRDDPELREPAHRTLAEAVLRREDDVESEASA